MQTVDRPTIAIFLELDGVFNRDYTCPRNTDRLISSEFGGEPAHTTRCDGCSTCRTAESILFNQQSVARFQELLDRITKLANVHLIITSPWAEDYSKDDLKKILSAYHFSELIIDKISEDMSPVVGRPDSCILPHFDVKDGLPEEFRDLPAEEPDRHNRLTEITHLTFKCLAGRIHDWLQAHPDYLGLVVINGHDEHTHLSWNFYETLVSTYHNGKFLLNAKDTEKAYQVFERAMREKDETSLVASNDSGSISNEETHRIK